MIKFSIKTIPTILFFKNGKVVERHSGMASLAQLEEKLKNCE
ncbi:thioredoxin family protein [Propionibacterium freudenreichii]